MRHKDAHTQMLYELEQLQTELSVQWLGESLPTEWSGMEGWEPVAPHRTRVTLRLDSDMVRWFRKLGPGISNADKPGAAGVLDGVAVRADQGISE